MHQPLDIARPIFVGDHDKPVSLLSSIEQEFFSEYILPSLQQSSTTPRGENNGIDTFHNKVDTDESLLRRIQFGFLSHDEVETASSFLASSTSSIGPWLKQQLVTGTIATQAQYGVLQHQPPDVVGVSLLHAGQLLSAVALSMIVRELWPGTFIVWGGPHISGLGREAFELDLARRSYAADLFVAGHAEHTFVDLLN
jgi:hypothetical protein